ncbi:leucine-rich repeat domain-containing protein [Tenacibaculum agarivorans]|uniref:hypothetical protein n=1 Tax=Tenacibaculum agarivorans TaxID=1908389 RepID=UPI00094B8B33|nr:hypothetical protein [Tenacibaculum agarivorans]
MKIFQKAYYLIWLSLFFLIVIGCGDKANIVNKTKENFNIEEQIELIPKSKSFNASSEIIFTKHSDSILQLKASSNSKEIKRIIKASSSFPNLIHLEFNLSLLTQEKLARGLLKDFQELDFTKFKNLKAITISGDYNKSIIDVLVKKISFLAKIDLLTLNLKPDSHLIRNKKIKLSDVYKLSDDFCLLNINTLIIQGKRLSFYSEKSIPYYTSITLPSCFTNKLQVSRIIYDHKLRETTKRRDFEQFRFHKKSKLTSNTSIKIDDTGAFYEVRSAKNKYSNKDQEFYISKTTEFIEDYTNFIQQLLQVKSAEEIILNNAFIDSIPEAIGQLKKLKKLSILNGDVSYFPSSLDSLSDLEVFKVFNNNSNIYFNKQIKGLKKLKNILLVNTGLSNGFPNFVDINKLEQLIFLDRNTVDTMPRFLNKQQNLKVLIWRYSNINLVPDGLNNSNKLDIVNLDDNKLTGIENIIEVGEKAFYFSYDINNIPYEKREIYNKRIYPKGQLLEDSLTQKKMDDLYETREIPFITRENINEINYAADQNTVINKFNRIREYIPIRRNDLRKDKLFKAIKEGKLYRGVSFEKSKNDLGVFSDEEIELLESFFDLIEAYKIEPLHVFKFYNDLGRHDIEEKIPSEEFSTKSIKNLGVYEPIYKGYEFLDYKKGDIKGSFDYGKLKHLRKAYVSDQEGINNITKIKGLRYLQINNIENIKSIPECFCELKELDTLYVRDLERTKFSDQYVDIRDEISGDLRNLPLDTLLKDLKEIGCGKENLKETIERYRKRQILRNEMKTFQDRVLFEYDHIKTPDCMKKMKFKQVRYPGMVRK